MSDQAQPTAAMNASCRAVTAIASSDARQTLIAGPEMWAAMFCIGSCVATAAW
jgi:hypothetical protein